MTLISLDERSKEESAMFEARRITSTQAKPAVYLLMSEMCRSEFSKLISFFKKLLVVRRWI
jgi:hypothetical protein